jgi:hypothetical protein
MHHIPHPPGERAPAKPESNQQRVNRNFNELLQEVRVAQTGVQILFGFLLTVPFSNRWPRVTALQEIVYTLTVLACAVAVALLVAPVSLHRRVFRKGRKPDLVRWADNLARAGLRALLVAVIGVVFLVLDAVRGVVLAAPLTVAVALVYVLLWYRLPNSVRKDAEDDEAADDDEGLAEDEESPDGDPSERDPVTTPRITAPGARGFRE